MTIYDEIKAKHGDGPAYPNRNDFTSYFGYAGGKPLGAFPTKDAAIKAGAAVTEKTFDEASYRAASDAYTAHQTAIGSDWQAALFADSPLNEATFKIVMAKAWEDGHSAGHGEVEIYLDELTVFAQKIIDAHDIF